MIKIVILEARYPLNKLPALLSDLGEMNFNLSDLQFLHIKNKDLRFFPPRIVVRTTLRQWIQICNSFV